MKIDLLNRTNVEDAADGHRKAKPWCQTRWRRYDNGRKAYSCRQRHHRDVVFIQ